METLEIIAWIFVLLGVATGLAILRDVIRHPQPMQIMNVTWPVNGLFTPVFGWWVYKKLCLLYTSPSPRDKRQSRMPSSA